MNLIEDLISRKTIRSPLLVKAFREIDRADFLPRDAKAKAEIDSPIPIGYGQTNSQPTTVAMMLEWLDPQPGQKILDAGCGSGWTTALLAHVVGEQGKVYGLEIIGELASLAEHNISKYGYLESGTAQIVVGDAHKGLKEFAPYDRILVSAAAREVPPELTKELKCGGRMVIPVGERYGPQEMRVIDKDASGNLAEKIFPGFIFVPLVKEQEADNH